MTNNKLKLLMFSIVLTMLFSVSVLSQTGTATITGTVTDDQSNVVPGATVTLIGSQGTRRSAVTNNTGVYTFTSIQPGSYSVEVESTGFKKASVSSFAALVDKTTDINVKLEVGAVTETVNIDASGIESIVNTQDASLGNNFVAKQIEQLPLEGRNVANLLSLQAGVTPGGAVAGSRSDQANITLDGIDVNDQQTGLNIDQTAAFAPVIRVNPDSVDEFRVTTSNPDAGKGRSSGAQVSLITKSGNNEFTGAVYEYHRNTITTANNYFNNLAGIERPKLIRNLFGGRFSGPIVKDRAFFFYNYEGMREAKGTSVNRLVPLASLGQGSIRFYDNTNTLRTLTTAQINSLTISGTPVVDVNNAATSVLADAATRYPSNNTQVGDGLNTGGYRFNASTPVNQNAHTARFDFNLTSDQKHVLSTRFNYQQDVAGGTSNFPDTPPTNTWSHPLGMSGTHTWLISSNKTNRFSFGLTPLAFSNQGDSADNAISFRDVYAPALFARTFSRVNPTYNITDDFTWLKGNHTLQFGTNIRIIRNERNSFGAAFDNGVMNFGFYSGSGSVLLTPVNQYLATNFGTSIDSGWTRSVQTGMTAVLGRLSQYTANYNFGIDGSPLATGSPAKRIWATEEYDWYVQDVWKLRPNVTLTLGLRYGLSRPVYETQGFQVAPNIALQEYFERRVAASAQGQNYTEPLILDTVGPKNGKPGFYDWDKNNFQPRIAVAWSPKVEDGWLAKILGTDSVFRGGFAMTNDYFGQQLAVTFDAANTLGFATSRNIAANTYNITTNPAPLFTGFNMAIGNLPGITPPANLTFPQQQPANNARRIETSLDTNLVSPVNYSWNVSYGRNLPGKMYLDISYLGRAARNLLATRDVMMANDLTDPSSGQTWNQAATILEQQRRAGLPVGQVINLPFFENMYAAGSIANAFYGANSGLSNTQAIYLAADDYMGGNDWTYMTDLLDRFSGKRLFYQSQYGALTSFGTIASSNYHAATVSVRQRLKGVSWDFNYTYSKSMDDASGLQNSGGFGAAFIMNPLQQRDSWSVSDFDLTHIINFNNVWDIPIGRGQQFGSGMGKVLDALIGGWQISSIFRYNSGAPFRNFFDDAGWVTNWNLKSGGVRIADVQISPNKTSGTTARGNVPNLFSDPKAAYNSFRSPFPGEGGDRNQLRLPGYIALDAGLAKSFRTPWSENQRAIFRWDVFNVTNSAQFTGLANTSLGYTPDQGGNPPASWGNFTNQQGSPRVMQFAFRYEF